MVSLDFNWPDIPNPFDYLGSAAGKVIADGWTAAMLGLWSAGLWVLRLVLNIMDAFLTPDISEDGPGAQVYRTTFWIAGVFALTLCMLQLGVAAFRRDGRSLATVMIGVGQFGIVWAAWIAYGVGVIAACGGLTRALMEGLLKVDSWSAWNPWDTFATDDITDGTVATVLGLLGLLLWVAAIGHLLVMLARGGALMVLAAATPISAAGLLGDAGKTWFWKSLRWFHAAAFTPVMTVLVLGIGVQMTTGVANGQSDKMSAAIGTALPGVVLILIGCFSPLALFKLLAFVEPGTSSGAAMRAGLAAQGGLTGLLSGSPPSADSNGAARIHAHGRSDGEAGAENATTDRFSKTAGGVMSTVGGAVGSAAATGLGAMATIGVKGAAIGSDLTSQMGVGQSQGYQPDFSEVGSKKRSNSASSSSSQGDGNNGGPDGADSSLGSGPGSPQTPIPPALRTAALPTAKPSGGNSDDGAGAGAAPSGAGGSKAGPGGAAGGAGAGGGAEAAAAVVT